MSDDPIAAVISELFMGTLEELFQLAIHFQFGVGEIHALVEKAAVSAGQVALREDGAKDPSNSSDLALLTGLNRDMVIKLLKMGRRGVREKPFQSPIRRVIRGWKSLDGYCEPDGSPKILAIRGASPSFHVLVNTIIGPDLSPKRILKRLSKLGFVRYVGNRSVQLIRNEVVGQSAIDQVKRLSDVCKLLRTIVQLVNRREPIPYLRFIETAGMLPELAAIQQTQMTRQANVLFNTRETALAHDLTKSEGGSGQTQSFSAAMFILREPELGKIINLLR